MIRIFFLRLLVGWWAMAIMTAFFPLFWLVFGWRIAAVELPPIYTRLFWYGGEE